MNECEGENRSPLAHCQHSQM